MAFTLRKVERRTIWEATSPCELNPEAFAKLSDMPYQGDLADEQEFVKYIQDLCWEDYYEIGEELESLGYKEDADSMFDLFEGSMEIYSDSSEKGETSWMEIGEADESYTKYGGFNSRFDTMD